MSFVVPLIFILTLAFAFVKKTNAYSSFIEGAKGAIPLAASIFPFVAAMIMTVELMRASGFCNLLQWVFRPLLCLLGVPQELCELVILRPFSGSGSLAILTDVLRTYGADSYVGRCASVIYGGAETVFYVAAVYFSGTKVKKLGAALPIALVCNVLAASLACFWCKLF